MCYPKCLLPNVLVKFLDVRFSRDIKLFAWYVSIIKKAFYNVIQRNLRLVKLKKL